MKTIVLYKTDFKHSFSSRELLGVYTNKNKFIKDVNKIISDDLKTDSGSMDYEEEKDNIKWHQEFFLQKKQTQGLHNFELLAEEIETNTIF